MRLVLSTLKIASNTIMMSIPAASTCSVDKLLCINTLSMMTWVNSGVASPNNWMTNEAANISYSVFRYFQTAGTNQNKSNGRLGLSRRSRVLTRTTRPAHACSKAARSIRCGRIWRGSPTMTWSSRSTRNRTTYSPDFSSAMAGSVIAVRRSHWVNCPESRRLSTDRAE